MDPTSWRGVPWANLLLPILTVACGGGKGDQPDSQPFDAAQAAVTDAAEDQRSIIAGDGPFACNLMPGPKPSLGAIVTNLPVTQSGSHTLVAPDGFALDGRFAFGTLPTNAFVTNPWGRLTNRETQFTYRPRFAFSSSEASYEIVVPPGRYDMNYSLEVGFHGLGSITQIGHDVIDVCGDSTHDLKVPPFPPSRRSSVTVTGLEALGDATLREAAALHLYREDRALVVAASLKAPKAEPVVFQVTAPDGRYQPQLAIKTANGTTGIDFEPRDFSGDFTLPLPALHTVSGAIDASSPNASSGSRVVCTGSDPRIETLHSYQVEMQDSFARFNLPAPLRYSLQVATGARCRLSALDFILMNATSMGTTKTRNSVGVYETPYRGPIETIGGNITRDHALPEPGSPVVLTVTVQDVRGVPLWGYVLEASVTTFSTPALDGGEFSIGKHKGTSVATEDAGQAFLQLLPGTYSYIKAW